MSTVVRVYNLVTDETIDYVGITPKQAVIAAYAQSRGDWNTWDYEAKYGDQLKKAFMSWNCGDFVAKTDVAK